MSQAWSKNTRILIYLAAIAFIVVFATYGYFGMDTVNAFLADPFSNPGKRCLNHNRKDLLDPNSAYVVDYEKRGNIVIVNARAKNSYSAFIPVEFRCAIDEHGLIDTTGTFILDIKKLTGQD